MADEKPPEEPKTPPALRSVKGGGKRPIGPVPHSLYEAMADTYLKGSRAAKELVSAHGVAFRTAKKAIDHGWPDKKWPSLKERAVLYDKIHAQATASENPERAARARDWLKMREDYLNVAGGVRGVVAKSVFNLMNAVDLAVANQVKPMRQVHFVEELDKQGRVIRRTPKTLIVDVTLQPSIFDVAAAVNQLASALERTGSGELGQLLAKVPQDALGTGRKTKLTDEHIAFIAENQGRLPPGITIADLGEGWGRPI